MIEYLVEGVKFRFDYQELKSTYKALKEMSDQEFMDNLVEAAHLACIVSSIKGTEKHALSDLGIVHELIHLMKPNSTTTPIIKIRELFNRQLELA